MTLSVRVNWAFFNRQEFKMTLPIHVKMTVCSCRASFDRQKLKKKYPLNLIHFVGNNISNIQNIVSTNILYFREKPFSCLTG
jgi:hypothetical protein